MPPISLFYSLSYMHTHMHAHTHTHTHTQMSHCQVVFVLETRPPEVAVGEPLLLQEGKLRVRMVCSSLQVTPPISLFYSLPFSHAHEHACMCTHTHAHTQMSHHQVVFVLETRQPEVGVGEPLLLQFQQVGKLRVRMVCSSLQVTLNAFHFTILLPSFSTCICPPPPPPPHTHTVPSSGGVHSVDKATRGRGGGHGRRTTALVVPPTEDPESENGVSDVPSSGGVRSGDKATRGRGGGRGRRTTARTVPARGETESENGVSDVPSSGGVRSGDTATRGDGGGHSRRATAFTVPARGETESENSAFLPPGCLPFHYFALSLFHMHMNMHARVRAHTHAHTHTQMSHHQVVFVLETRQPEVEVEVAVGEPLLVQFQQEGKLRVRMVCSSLQVTSECLHFTISLPSFLTFTHAHTHTHSMKVSRD